MTVSGRSRVPSASNTSGPSNAWTAETGSTRPDRTASTKPWSSTGLTPSRALRVYRPVRSRGSPREVRSGTARRCVSREVRSRHASGRASVSRTYRMPSGAGAGQDVGWGTDRDPYPFGSGSSQDARDLGTAVTGADHQDVLPAVGGRRAVVGRVQQRAGEGRTHGPVGDVRGVAAAGGHHDRASGHRTVGGMDQPLCFRTWLGPLDALHRGGHLDVEQMMDDVTLQVADVVVPAHPPARRAAPTGRGVSTCWEWYAGAGGHSAAPSSLPRGPTVP